MENSTAGQANIVLKGFRYDRHCSEQTFPYHMVGRYNPELAELVAAQGRPLPR